MEMERQEIKSEKFIDKCRICLSNNFDLKSVFELDVDKMIMACASVQVQMNDGLPQLICVHCINQVNSAYSFKKLCEENDMALRQAVIKIEAEDVLGQAVVKIEPEEQPSYYNDAEVTAENKMLLYSAGEDQGNARCSNAQTIVEQSSIINVENEYLAGKAISKYKWYGQELNVDAKMHIKESDKQDEDIHICCICKKEFMELKQLKRHLILAHTSTKKCRLCKTCLREFPNKRTRKAHNRMHFVNGKLPIVDKAHCCKICGYSCRTAANLSNHMCSHKAEGPLYLCLTCGKALKNAEDLPIHMQKHPGEQRCVCSLCGKEVSHLNDLILHTHFHRSKTSYAVEHTT